MLPRSMLYACYFFFPEFSEISEVQGRGLRAFMRPLDLMINPAKIVVI
jgi:hypothetical protein